MARATMPDVLFDKLLDTLRGAPVNPELWPQALAHVSASLNLHACAILHTDMSGAGHHAYLSHGVDPEVTRLYAAGYGEQDVYRPKFMELATSPDGILMGEQLCSFREMKRTAFGQDVMRKGDIQLWCAVSTVRTKAAVENISLYHPWNTDPPASSALNAVRQVLPHLNNALRLRAHIANLEGIARDLHAALHKSNDAVLLFDRAGRCGFANSKAEAILRKQDGLRYTDRTLHADISDETSALHVAVRKAVSAARRELRVASVVRITRKSGSPLHLRIAPLPETSLLPNTKYFAIAIIGTADQDARFPSEAAQSIYKLTRAEQKLSALLLEGHGLEEAANLLQITKETARTQLKLVFNKTGTRRQGELIALLSAIPK